VSSEAKNLEAIVRAIEQHDRNCEYPAAAVAMNPFEVERLGWDTIRGLPIHADPNIQTGRFEVVCGGDEQDLREEEAVEAVAEQVVPVGAPVQS
jgi:hypothetical protein